MSVSVILGLQWGDEGKGKLVDNLAKDYDIVARFQGGPNAGHTLYWKQQPHVLHQIPSGIFYANTLNLIGHGVIIDPIVFQKEIIALEKLAVDNIYQRIYLAFGANIILPTHVLLDKIEEEKRRKQAIGSTIGSTLRGIGPCYQDKVGRKGLRIFDITENNLKDKYKALKEQHVSLVKHLITAEDWQVIEEQEEVFFQGIECIKKFPLIDNFSFLSRAVKEGKKILAEGAQGTLLDIDCGTYPYVTSSTTGIGGALTGLGLSPRHLQEIYGVSKSYTTRVGQGPFPTELTDSEGEKLQQIGKEFGSTTQRNRRCGWLDIVALRYAVQLNGVNKLLLTKVDVLSSFEEIKICTHYQTPDGKIISEFSPYLPFHQLTPVYESLPSWKIPAGACYSDFNQLDAPLQSYLTRIEQLVDVEIVGISYGVNREDFLLK